MSLFSKLIDELDDLMLWLTRNQPETLAEHCELEGVEDERSLVARDGSLASIIKIEGYRELIGAKKFNEKLILPLEKGLGGFLTKSSHKIQVFFMQDPERTSEEIARLTEKSQKTILDLCLDLQDLREEQEKRLIKSTHHEEMFMVVWTSSVEKENKKKKKQEINSIQGLYERHDQFLDHLVKTLRENKIQVKELSAKESCIEIRKSLGGVKSVKGWVPGLMGDTMTPTHKKIEKNVQDIDISNVPLNDQIAGFDHKVIEDKMIKIGDKVYYPLVMEYFPNKPEMFTLLLNRLSELNCAWRFSLTFEPDEMNFHELKKIQNDFEAGPGLENRRIKSQVENKKRSISKENQPIVKVRASFCTWGSASDIEAIEKQGYCIAQSLNDWGGSDFREYAYNPVEGVVTSALGLTSYNVGVASAVELEDVLKILPLNRPASPWTEGSFLFKTADKKVIPYAPMASNQSSWLSLLYGSAGTGKSVLLHAMNLALCTAPENRELPQLSILEMSSGSEGFLCLLKDALPREKKKLVNYVELKQNQDYINPLDTYLGARYPSKEEMTNLVQLVRSMEEDHEPLDLTDEQIRRVLSGVYHWRALGKGVKEYQPGRCLVVDEILADQRIEAEGLSWWQVADLLFEKEYKEEALNAQQQALPKWEDLALFVEDIESGGQQILDEELKSTWVGFIQNFIKECSWLNHETNISRKEASVMALNVESYMKKDKQGECKTNAALFLTAHQWLKKAFYEVSFQEEWNKMNPENNAASHRYLKDHQKNKEAVSSRLKKKCYEDFHRVASFNSVMNVLEKEAEMSREKGQEIAIVTQKIDHLKPSLIDKVTGLFILEGGKSIDKDLISQVFGWDKDSIELNALQNAVRKPSINGNTFLVKWKVNNEWYDFLMSFNPGPLELWSFSTEAVDIELRKKLYERLSFKDVRQLLAMKYPNGSARDDVIDRRDQLKDKGVFLEQEGINVLDDIVKEVIQLKLTMENHSD